MNVEELRKTVIEHHTTQNDDKWPSALNKASKVADTLGLTVERVIELADCGYLPHWRIDGGKPLFQIAEVKKWAKRNLLNRIEGQDLPIEFKITVMPDPAKDPPTSLQNLKNLKELPNKETTPGIYFLVKNNEVVYVGQSVSPFARMSSHSKEKDFNRVYLLPVPEDLLNPVESAFIRYLRPELNADKRGYLHTPGRDNQRENDEEIISYYTETNQ